MFRLPADTRLIVTFAFMMATGLLAGCATTPTVKFAPAGQRQLVTIRVFYNAKMHSQIELPAPGGKFDDWAYGEMYWTWDSATRFRDHARSCFEGTKGALGALFWPSPGVVTYYKLDRPYPESYPEDPLRIWTFQITPEGLENMRAWLEASKQEKNPLLDQDWQKIYKSTQRYHVFHTCHHYVAKALKEGGVPMRTSICWMPWGFWDQLDKHALDYSERAGKQS